MRKLKSRKIFFQINLRCLCFIARNERGKERIGRPLCHGSRAAIPIPRLLYIYHRASVCHTSIHWVALNVTWCAELLRHIRDATHTSLQRSAPTCPTRPPIGRRGRGKGGKHRSTDPDWIATHPLMLTRAHDAILTGELIFLRVS